MQAVVEIDEAGKGADAGEQRGGHDLRAGKDSAQEPDDRQVAAIALLRCDRVARGGRLRRKPGDQTLVAGKIGKVRRGQREHGDSAGLAELGRRLRRV